MRAVQACQHERARANASRTPTAIAAAAAVAASLQPAPHCRWCCLHGWGMNLRVFDAAARCAAGASKPGPSICRAMAAAPGMPARADFDAQVEDVLAVLPARCVLLGWSLRRQARDGDRAARIRSASRRWCWSSSYAEASRSRRLAAWHECRCAARPSARVLDQDWQQTLERFRLAAAARQPQCRSRAAACWRPRWPRTARRSRQRCAADLDLLARAGSARARAADRAAHAADQRPERSRHAARRDALDGRSSCRRRARGDCARRPCARSSRITSEVAQRAARIPAARSGVRMSAARNAAGSRRHRPQLRRRQPQLRCRGQAADRGARRAAVAPGPAARSRRARCSTWARARASPPRRSSALSRAPR